MLRCSLQAVNAEYAEANARMGPYQEVMFEGEKITLDIPKEGIALENGWTITPDTYPGVSALNSKHFKFRVDFDKELKGHTYIQNCFQYSL